MEKASRSSRIKNWSLGDFLFLPSEKPDEFIPNEIPLANLSDTGLGLWIQDTRVYLVPGTVIKGKISSKDIAFDNVEVRIIRKNNFIYGCNFTKEVPGLGEFLSRNYAVEQKADHMISVNTSFLAPKAEGTPHWHSDGFSELYYIENNSLIAYYRINFQELEIERLFDPAKKFRDLGSTSRLTKSNFNEIERFLHHINALPFEVKNRILDDLMDLIE